MMTEFYPTGSNLLLQLILKEEKTESGIFLPETARRELNQGIILKVGPMCTDDFKPGNTVIFTKHAESLIEIDGTEYAIVSPDNVLLMRDKPIPLHLKPGTKILL